VPQGVHSRLATTGRRPRRARALRRLRAGWYHVAALGREFRVPLLGFVVATVVGGFFYGELHAWARGSEAAIPYFDRPYTMLQLMLLEAPEDVPREWFLALFWYAMPAIFIVLVGLGAADFLDLFFNREDDRDRWSEALAMTYRHHAVVLGAGGVGLRVVRDLRDMGMEVVVVDNSPDPEAEQALSRLGAPVVHGDARLSGTLERAGLPGADVFVACTGDDRINLESAMKAREVCPDVRIVARVWDREFGHQMERFGLADQVLSAADLSAPAFAGAALGMDITQTVELNGAEYSTIRLTATPKSFLVQRSVGQIERDNQLEIVLIGHEGTMTVDPEPDARIEPGDDVVVFARHDRILEVVTRNRAGATG
jgi:Trk K+ transport system NAD-binding subunit